MKFILFIIIVFVLHNELKSCDICGCSVSGNYFGLLPQYRKHFIGLRVHYRTYSIKHPPLFAGESVQYSNDLVFSTEIWGRYQIHKRLQLIGSMPYQFNQRKENEIKLSSNGVGDGSCFIFGNVWKTSDTSQVKIKQSISLGAGIKVPTGKHENTVVYKGLILPGFQMGSASWDFPVSLIYIAKLKSLGINTEMTYQFNTLNRYNYHFGNRLSSALRVFYWKYRPAISVLPQLGISYEHYNSDKRKGRWVRYTGGSALWSFAGLDLYKGRWGLGINSWLPIYQNIGEKHIKMFPRITTNFLILF